MKPTALVAGAGGFIGGHLVQSLASKGFSVVAVDKKPIRDWYLYSRVGQGLGVTPYSRDLSLPKHCQEMVGGVDVVYNLAADMGGMGFIERHRVDCMRSVLINTNLIEAASLAGVREYFFASSACVYNTHRQNDPRSDSLKEKDAYPAMAERGYGWEKLFSELVCQEYGAERNMDIYIARFHNVYGPWGTWAGGREKAPAAICRKVLEAIRDKTETIDIWGDGTQVRSFMYIDDCIHGIHRIMSCPTLKNTPINLGSSQSVSINQLVSLVELIAEIRPLARKYDLTAPQGVAGRNSDNSFIRRMLEWEPSIPLVEGMRPTFNWIKEQMG